MRIAEDSRDVTQEHQLAGFQRTRDVARRDIRIDVVDLSVKIRCERSNDGNETVLESD